MASPQVLLLVTTRKDAEITQRLLREVNLDGETCESLADLRIKAAGGSALLLTEEMVRTEQFEELVSIIHPGGGGSDLPTVLLTKGGARSTIAAALLDRLQTLTILERPAPVSSIISAVRAAVRVRAHQRELIEQVEKTTDLQRRLSRALDASELGTFHCPFPLGVVQWDAQCAAHFWVRPGDEVDFDLFYSRLHPEDRERTQAAVRACVSDGVKYDVEYRVVSPAGELRWIRATGQTRRDAQGQPLAFSGTTQDITARKQLEEERDRLFASERSARLASEQANRLKDEFLSTLSHELRTPLNAITGWLDLMKEDIANPESIREGLEVIDRNVRAQSQLIDDLLDVSRIISGKVRLDVTPVSLGKVVSAALETVRPAALAKHVKLDARIAPSLPPISGDFGRLQQIAWNLLTNAIKFTPAGGSVQVTLEPVGASLEVSVTDTGEGIAPEFLPYVFERFRQADGSPSRRHGGLGLGLSIVKTLVEMHGGRVIAQSPGKGRGSTFSFRIPVRVASSADAPVPTARASSRLFSGAFEKPDLSGLKILVVDDEPDARTMMHRLLETCHATSFEAASAHDAERVIAERNPDIVLSDIGMPGTDGYQFIREVRRRGLTTPAVALTAFARPEDRVRSIQAGFQAHLTKPIEPAELLVLVASLCGRNPRNR
jgi:signal transduction histidine kinase